MLFYLPDRTVVSGEEFNKDSWTLDFNGRVSRRFILFKLFSD